MKKYYSVQQAGKEASVYIFGDIAPAKIFDSDVTAHSVIQEIENLDADVIHVHIDSCGGAVSEGWGIYNALRDHPARIITHGDGFVASAALYPFMAGDERRASALSAYYFHNVMISAFGYADDLRAAADEAELFTEIGLKAFTERTKLSAEQARGLMDAETWLTPEMALEYGIATAIVSGDGARYTQSARKDIMRRICGKEEKEPEQRAETLIEEKTEQQKNNEPETGQGIMRTLAGFFIERGN